MEIPEIRLDLEKLKQIPEDLRRRRQWICWKYKVNDKGKLTKVPVAPWATGHYGQASATDPNNVTTFDMALEYARKNGLGLGFCFFSGDKLAGIDLDDLNDPMALYIIGKANSYTEYSPSGRGVHIIGYGKLKSAIKEDKIEVYDRDRFFTVTGEHYENSPLTINDIQPVLDELKRMYGKSDEPNVSDVPEPPEGWANHVNQLGYTLREIRERDEILDAYLRGELAGKPSPSEADMGTLERLLYWGYTPDEAVAILKKFRWREKLQREDYIQGMLSKLLPVEKRAKPKVAKKKDVAKEEGEEEKLNLYKFAQEILAETPIVTDSRTYLMFWWDGKRWRDGAEALLQEKLVEAEKENYKPYHFTTLKEIIQGLTFKNGLEEPPPNLICFENGVLDLNTMQLMPHDPKYFFRNIIHANFNPEAKCPRFLKWLEEIQPEEEERKAIQELFGYSLYRDYPLHYIFFLVGVGRNGKGTLLRTLIGLLGKENCASIPLERLFERFQATNLWGKLVNIVSEPKIKKVTTEAIKQLTGQDLITGEIKGKQNPIKFTNYAKLIVMANRLPPVSDESYAWWGRVIVIEFPVIIPPEKIIPNIEEEWLSDPEERSGIINWALEGLKRLLETKRFTKSQAMEEAIEQYRKWSQPAQYFLDKYCEYGANYWIAKKELYEAYKIACEMEDLPILDERQFSIEVKKRPRVTVVQKRVLGKVIRGWRGLRLKPDLEATGEAGEAGEAGRIYPGKASVERENNKENKNFKSIEIPVSPVSSVSPIMASDFVLCEVVGCKRLDLTQHGVCSYCKRSPVELTHIVRTFKHSGLLVCEDCAHRIKAHLRELMEEAE